MKIKSKSYLLDNPQSLNKEKIRLAKQAEILFALESPFLQSFAPNQPVKRILDLGCGNGVYLTLLEKLFDSPCAFGFEKNLDLINQAKTIFPDLKIQEGDLLDDKALGEFITKINPNYLNLRFVLQHLRETERKHLLKTIRQNLTEGCDLIIIEVDDSQITYFPKYQVFETLIDRTIKLQAKRGGDRTVAGKLETELAQAGFTVLEKIEIGINVKKNGVEPIIQIELPVWQSYSNDLENSQIDQLVMQAREILQDKKNDSDFKFNIPCFIFRARKA